MKPCYDKDGIMIYQGDCLTIVPKLAGYDLVFADPPFNVGKDYGGSADKRIDYVAWCKAWMHQCWHGLQSTGSFYFMTLTRYLEWQMPYMAAHGVFINLISWRNVSTSYSRRAFWGEYQPIMLYGKTNNYVFNTYVQTNEPTKRWDGKHTSYRGQLKDRWDDIPFVYAGSIKHKEAILLEGTRRKAHPCQMPEGLAERIILFSSNEGDTILDPFLGSGTTAVVAKRLKRRCIGIELNEHFCELAIQRTEGAL